MKKTIMIHRTASIIVAYLIMLFLLNNLLITIKTNQMQFTLHLVSKNIYERLDSMKNIVELSAVGEEVNSSSPQVAEQYLINIVKRNPQMWSHFLITDSDGIEYVHTEGSAHYGTSLKDREYYLVPWQEKKTVIAQPIHSVSTGRKIIAIGTPLFQDSESKGVLVGFTYLQYLSEILNNDHITKNSYLIMSNLDGTISAHPNEEYVLNQNIKDIINDEKVVSQITNLSTGSKITRVDGRLSLLVYEPVHNNQLSLSLIIPFTEVFSLELMIIGILLLTAISVALIVFFWKKINTTKQYGNTMALQASTDELTGLKNRYWLSQLDMNTYCEEFLTILFFDVDNFKDFNDKHNHAYGDKVLQFIAESMQAFTRPNTDESIRYSGDEFMILFKDTTVESVQVVTQRLMNALAGYVNDVGQPDKITISCGIVSAQKGQKTLENLIVDADNATYKAKNSGKNKMILGD